MKKKLFVMLVSCASFGVAVAAIGPRWNANPAPQTQLTQFFVPCEYTFSNGVRVTGNAIISPILERPGDHASVRIVAGSLLFKAGQSVLSHVNLMQTRECATRDELMTEGGPLNPRHVLDFDAPLASVNSRVRILPVPGRNWGDVTCREQVLIVVEEQ